MVCNSLEDRGGAPLRPCKKSFSTSSESLGAAIECVHGLPPKRGDVADGGGQGGVVPHTGFDIVQPVPDLVGKIEECKIEIVKLFELLLVDLDGVEQARVAAGRRADLVHEGAQLCDRFFHLTNRFELACANQIGLQRGCAFDQLIESSGDGVAHQLVCVAPILTFHITAKTGDIGCQFLEYVHLAAYVLIHVSHLCLLR